MNRPSKVPAARLRSLEGNHSLCAREVVGLNPAVRKYFFRDRTTPRRSFVRTLSAAFLFLGGMGTQIKINARCDHLTQDVCGRMLHIPAKDANICWTADFRMRSITSSMKSNQTAKSPIQRIHFTALNKKNYEARVEIRV